MTSRAINSSYTHSGVQFGNGRKLESAKNLVQNVQKAIKFAKDHKLVTAGKQFTDTVGLTGLIDKKTNGLYSKGANFGISQGYGKKKRRSKK